MILSIIDVVVGAKLRKKDVSCDHQISMGLKSGEYRDKQITLAPQASIIGTIDANLWAGKLSITTTAPFPNSGSKNFDSPEFMV
jgi:hypothetical protein